MRRPRTKPRGAHGARTRCFRVARRRPRSEGHDRVDQDRTPGALYKEGDDFAITSVALTTRAVAPGMDNDAFIKAA